MVISARLFTCVILLIILFFAGYNKLAALIVCSLPVAYLIKQRRFNDSRNIHAIDVNDPLVIQHQRDIGQVTNQTSLAAYETLEKDAGIGFGAYDRH